nr:MAG TPA: hypothetical protein [Bacteriophage sp.]
MRHRREGREVFQLLLCSDLCGHPVILRGNG